MTIWPFLASVFLHAGILLLAYVGTAEREDPLMAEETAVFVDIVPLAETSNPPPPGETRPKPPPPQPASAKPKPKPAEPKPAAEPPPPPPQPEAAQPAPPPPKQEVAEPLPQPKPLPEPKVAEPEPTPRVAQPPEPQREPQADAPVPPALLTLKPKTKPSPPPKPTRTQAPAETPADRPEEQPEETPAPDFASVLDTVAALARQPESDSRPSPPAPPAATPGALSPSDPNQPVTMTEVDLVRRQIERCWNVPAGAKDMRNMAVAVRVEMNRDGTPRTAVIKDEARMRSDPFFRAAAESAVRAVLNPRCHPFKLPAEKYDRWRTMTVVFDPKEMFGT